MADEPTAPAPSGVSDESFQRLLVVQDLDTALAQLRHRRDNLPERLELGELRRRFEALGRQAQPLRSELDGLARRLKEIEAQVQSTEERRAGLEQRMYNARGAARDLEAMAAEVEHLGARRSDLEDEELEVMERQEQLQRELNPLSDEQRQLQSRGRALTEALAGAEAAVDEELASLASGRQAEMAELPRHLADLYERLRSTHGGTGAARLVGDRCDGCHLSLPAMEVERIRQLPPDAVVTCEHCGRLLVRPAA